MEFSQITSNLFLGTTPGPEHYDQLRELGVTLVINMRIERRPYPDRHKPPLKFKWYPSIDNPFAAVPLFYLNQGSKAALQAIQAGGKVYVHCAQGRHRSVAMAASILIAQGIPPGEAMELLKARREAADPDIWYIRRQILRFAARQPVWRQVEDNQAG